MLYIRYESAAPNSRGFHVGIFGMVNGLARNGELTPEDLEWWRVNNAWYDAAYPDPGTTDPTIFDKTAHPFATCWFKSAATHLLERLPGYLDLLDRYGLAWVERRSEAPGKVIYEDDVQVVVTPWSRRMISTPITPELLRGALDLEPTERGVLPHRLPARARAQCDDPQLAMAEAQPSGVRLVFRTAATVVELDVLATKTAYRGVPPRPDGVYDLLVDGRLSARASAPDGNLMIIDMASGSVERRPGPVCALRFADLAPTPKDIEIWLPHKEITELVALRTDAPVELAPQSGRRVWVHHGSSISHGSDAASPTMTWPAVAASLGGVELVNLGFGGGALLDPFTARAVRDTPAELISVKIGINLVNADLMRLRAFGPAVHGFLDTIREGQPDTPLLVISPIHCPIHEHTPGPGAPDMSSGTIKFRATGDPAERGRLTLTVIREQLAKIVAARAADDPRLSYLDGRELYGAADYAELPLPDELHPDAATHLRMGERFAKLVFSES